MICGELYLKLIQQCFRMDSKQAIVIWDFALRVKCTLATCLKTSEKGWPPGVRRTLMLVRDPGPSRSGPFR